MAELLVGACLDNVDHPPDESYRRLELMRAGVVSTLWTEGTKHRPDVYQELERRLSRPRYLVRVGPSRRCTVDEWTTMATWAVFALPQEAVREGRVTLRALNEPNHPDEGAWSAADYLAFLRGVEPIVHGWRGVQLEAAGPSLGVEGWEAWLDELEQLAGDDPPWDRRGCNVYAGMVPRAARFVGRGGVDVTELSTLELVGGDRGRWIVERCVELAKLGVEMVTQFIVGGVTGGAWDGRYLMTDDEARAIGARGPIEVEEVGRVAPVLGLWYRQGDDIREKGVDDLVALCKRLGVGIISPKVSDGDAWQSAFDGDPRLAIDGPATLRRHAETYRAAGIALQPWVGARGFDVEAEAQLHAEAARAVGSLIVDFEWQYAGYWGRSLTGEPLFASEAAGWDAFLRYSRRLRELAPEAELMLCPDARQIDDLDRWRAIAASYSACVPQLYWTDFRQPWADVVTRGVLATGGLGLPVYPMLPGNATADDLSAALAWCRTRYERVYLFQRASLYQANEGVLAAYGAGAIAAPVLPVGDEREASQWGPLYQLRDEVDGVIQELEATGSHADALLASGADGLLRVLRDLVALTKVAHGAEAA